MDTITELLSLREDYQELRRQFELVAKKATKLERENARIRKDSVLFKKRNEELELLLKKRDETIAGLSVELSKYKNSNTPPSANPHLKQVKPKRSSGKLGRPPGCKGSTRSVKVADKTRTITAKECPGCYKTDLTLHSIKRRQIEELPPIKPVVVDVCREVLHCNSCGLDFVSRDDHTPTQGKFGIDVMVLIIFLRFILRGVLRKTSGFLGVGFALQMAPATVQAIIARAAKAAESEYTQLKQTIRNLKILYVDETSFSVLGANWWVWVFRNEKELLLVVRNSRGSDVIAEILGKDYNGIVVCDGWRAYDCLSNAKLQRCWAHLLRKSEELCDTLAGRNLNGKLHRMFKEIKRFNSKPHTEKQRKLKYERMTRQLKKTISRRSRHEKINKVHNYVRFHVESWLTCILYEGVEPTNNHAERGVRETVILRKIIGAFRSEGGTKVYENLASLLATWQLQEKDVKQELRRVLSQNMC